MLVLVLNVALIIVAVKVIVNAVGGIRDYLKD